MKNFFQPSKPVSRASKNYKQPESMCGQQLYQQAVSEFKQLTEQGQMIMEDLNGMLQERAELISQREDMDLLIEQEMEKYHFEYEFIIQNEEIEGKLQKQVKKIKEITGQIDQFTQQKLLLTSSNDQRLSEKTQLVYVDLSKQIQRGQCRLAIETKIFNELQQSKRESQNALNKRIQDDTRSAFKEYLQNQTQKLQKLKESCGQKFYTQMIEEHKKQIESLLTSQYRKKLQMISHLLLRYRKLQDQIEKNMNFVETNLTVDIAQVKKSIELKRDVMCQLQRSLQPEPVVVPSQQVDQLKKKVELLEIEKFQLEQQMIEMILRMEGSNDTKQINKCGSEFLYDEILSDISKSNQVNKISTKSTSSTSSQKKRRNSFTYSEINKQKQMWKTQRQLFEKLNESRQSDENNYDDKPCQVRRSSLYTRAQNKLI